MIIRNTAGDDTKHLKAADTLSDVKKVYREKADIKTQRRRVFSMGFLSGLSTPGGAGGP